MSTRAPLLRISRVAGLLSLVVATLAAAAAAYGLLSGGGAGRTPFLTVHGTIVQLYGKGLYARDSFLIGVGLRGTDAATLLLHVPLLLMTTRWYRAGSTRGALLLAGVLAYFAYYYASQSLGSAYNPLFLLYVTAMSASVFALRQVARSIPAVVLQRIASSTLPRRGIASFLFLIAIVLLAAWLPPVVGALIDGGTPRLVEHYTTVVTWVFDLGLIVPLAVTSGISILRRDPDGVLPGAIMLVLCLTIGVALLAQGLAQLLAGVPLSPGEIAAFMAPFALLTLGGTFPAVALFRRVE